MKLKVTHFGEKVLRQKGKAVIHFDLSLRELAENMLETMHANEGIGLAAQQVGVALQIFVADMRVSSREADYTWTYDGRAGVPLDLIMPLAAVNPEVTLSGPEAPYEEGCLSFPEIRGEVFRPQNVVMRYQDLNGSPHVLETNGLFGRVIQHEYDHLQGTVFIDRMKKTVLKTLDAKLKRLKRDTLIAGSSSEGQTLEGLTS